MTRTDDGWTASPGGLVRALVPAAARERRHVGRLDRRGRRRRRTVRDRRRPAAPGAVVGRRGRGLLRGLLQRHAVAAVPRRDPRLDATTPGSGRPTRRSTSASPTRSPRSPRPTPSCGSTTTTCSSCRRCCASAAADLRIGFFFHIPFPPHRAVHAAAVARRDRRRAARCRPASGSSANSAPRTSSPPPTVRDRAISDDERAPRRRTCTHVGAFPISIDVEEFEALAAGRATRQRSSTLPHPARRARGRPARRRPARLHEGHRPAPAGVPVAARRRHARHRALRDGAGGDADPRERRALPATSATRSSSSSVRSTARHARLGYPVHPLPVPVAAARRARRALPRRRRDARDAAPRRHEPRRQGVRRRPASTTTACWCCRSSPAPPTS